jgi:hypothetical protein
VRDDDGARYHDVAAGGLDRVATEWNGTVFARPVSETEARSNPFPRYMYVAPRDPAADQLAAAVAWYESVADWRSRTPPPLPEPTTARYPVENESEDESDVAVD